MPFSIWIECMRQILSLTAGTLIINLWVYQRNHLKHLKLQVPNQTLGIFETEIHVLFLSIVKVLVKTKIINYTWKIGFDHLWVKRWRWSPHVNCYLPLSQGHWNSRSIKHTFIVKNLLFCCGVKQVAF